MSNIWQISPSQRLKEWRSLRKQLDDIDDDLEVLNKLLDWWRTAPVTTRVIDPYNNEGWPDPWELIYNDLYDENVVTLGICYTLEYIDWPCTLQLIQCNEKNEVKLVIVVDDEHVINYNYGNIELIENIAHCDIIDSWESSDITR